MTDLPMQVFRAEVVSAVDLTPSTRCIVFGGAGLTHFTSTGVGDEYLRVIFPPQGRPNQCCRS